MRVTLENLRNLNGAVITRVTATENCAEIIASGPAGSVTLTLTGCEWNDERCETCRCDPDRVRVEIE